MAAQLSFGEALLIARRRRGMSQTGLATLAGVDPNTVRRVENGASWPQQATIEALDDALAGVLFRLLEVER